MADKETLIKFIKQHNCDLNVLKKFEKYEYLLYEKNQKFNLISKNTEKEIWTRHFLDSLLIAEYLDFNKATALDFGSGAGFPGIPLKIIFPSMKLYCLESIRKKTLFLTLLVDELDLKDVKVIQKRIEDLETNFNNYFDRMLVRAVKMNDEYLMKAFMLLQSGGSLILYKSMIEANEVDKIKTFPECQTIKERRIKKNVLGRRAFIIAEKR